jgi:hypothetical protein
LWGSFEIVNSANFAKIFGIFFVLFWGAHCARFEDLGFKEYQTLHLFIAHIK